MTLSKLTVKTKLVLAFCSLSLMILTVSIFANNALSDTNARLVNYISGVNARLLLSYEVRTAVERRAIAARDLANAPPQERAAIKAEVIKAHDDVQTRIAQLVKMATEPGIPETARELVATMAAVEAKYAPVALGITELAYQGRRDEAVIKMNAECRPLLAELIRAARSYRDYTAQHSRGLIAQASSDYAAQRRALIGLCVLAFIAAAGIGVWITRGLFKALGAEPADLGLASQRVAAGDLRAVPGASAAASGSVLLALAQMQASLLQVVSRVRQGAEAVSTASAEIAQGNQDLSTRTESQASALEETASSMEQLSSTVKQNADNARQARQLAESASHVATRGGQVVAQVVETMREIDDSARKIADIISMIDGIAFQTNILALNAAVEAARAGDQGKGFAVVASEVRSLAGRSAQAAREIKVLISTSVDRVEQGTTLADQAGSTMREIVTSIRRVTDIVTEISSASNEQSAGVAQVGEAVLQMDQTTQQNAALVEQMAAAAASLSSQARDLVATVGVFTTEEGVTAAAPNSVAHFMSRAVSLPVSTIPASPSILEAL